MVGPFVVLIAVWRSSVTSLASFVRDARSNRATATNVTSGHGSP